MMGRRSTVEVPCPKCGASNSLRRWEVIDLSVESWPVTGFPARYLNATRCAACSCWVREPPGTLLVFIARPQPLLVFSPTPRHANAQQERAQLIGILREAQGARWDDAWLQSVVIIERYLLHAIVSEGMEYAVALQAAVMALMSGKIPGSLQATLDARPILRSHMALAALDELTAVQVSPRARELGRQVAALLRGCQLWGFDDVSADFEEAGPRFAPMFERIVARDATPDTRALAIARGELLRELMNPGQPEWLQLSLWLAESLTGHRENTAVERERGLDLFLEALDVMPPAAPRRAKLIRDIGLALYERLEGDRADNVESAISRLDAALAHADSTEGQVLTLSNRATLLSERPSGDRADNIEQAIRDLGRAKELLDPQRDRSSYAHLMYTLGNLYQQRLTGEPVISQERARMAYEMALDHWPPSSTIEIARTRAALAGVHLNRLVDSKHSNSASAIAHAGASLQVLTAEQSPLEYLAANVTLGLAIGTDPQRLDTAIDVIANALASTEKITAPPERAHSLTQLAFLFGRRAGLGHEDDVDRAVTAYEQALELSPAPTQSRMECLRSLGGLLLRHRRWTKAVAAFDEAHALELQLDTGFSGPARRARLAAASAAGMRWAYALARAGNLERAVVIMDRFRARELRDALGKRHPDLQRLQTAAPELHRRYLDATSRVSAIDAAERERSMVKVQGKAVLAPEGLEADFAERRRALDELLAAIRRTPGFHRFNTDAEISDIWKAVLPNRPLAYLVTTEVGTLALLLQQDSAGPRIDIIRDDELNSARLQRLLVEWPSGGERSEGHVVCRPDPSGSEKLSLSWEGEQPTGGYLVGQISDPQHLSAGVRAIRETFAGLMAKLVGSIGEPRLEYLQLVTTGKLGLLPLHAALPGAMNGQELQAVSIVPSAVLLDTLRTADAEKARRKATLVGVANPLPHEEPLPFAPFELARIMRRFPGASKSAEEFGATREIVLKLLTREAHEDPIAYLHMACHGRYDLTQPLDSELSLAGGQGLKLIELLDGDLFAGIRLVTLSACQTAVTDVNEVPDEMGSLAAGFLAAGATGVVATLWAVDDLACALLFDRFYGELIRPDGTRAMEPAIALSRAQQWLRTLTARSLAALFEDAAHEQALPLLTSALAYFRERPGDEMCFADAEFWAGYIYLGA